MLQPNTPAASKTNQEALSEVNALIYAARHIARLIEVAADIIGDTCASDTKDCINAFDLGNSIAANTEILIKKVEKAMYLVCDLQRDLSKESMS